MEEKTIFFVFFFFIPSEYITGSIPLCYQAIELTVLNFSRTARARIQTTSLMEQEGMPPFHYPQKQTTTPPLENPILY